MCQTFPIATLYVENVSAAIYAAIRERAKRNRRSMAAEVTEVLARRRAAFRRTLKLQAAASAGPGPFSSTEEMVRELRAR